MSRFTLAQITDLHLRTEPASLPHGVDPLRRLERVVERIRSHPEAELVVVTGDICGDDRPETYEIYLRAIAPLRIPVHAIPGNHDHRAAFGRRLLGREDGTLHRSVRHRQVRLLLLDSLRDGRVEGRIGETQLAWVRRTLAGSEPEPASAGPEDRPEPAAPSTGGHGPPPPELTLAFVHHPPVATGIAWLDPHRIEDGVELVDALLAGGVSRLYFGHVHMPMALLAKGLVCLGAPATSLAFSDARGAEQVLAGNAAITWIQVDGADVRSWIELLPG